MNMAKKSRYTKAREQVKSRRPKSPMEREETPLAQLQSRRIPLKSGPKGGQQQANRGRGPISGTWRENLQTPAPRPAPPAARPTVTPTTQDRIFTGGGAPTTQEQIVLDQYDWLKRQQQGELDPMRRAAQENINLALGPQLEAARRQAMLQAGRQGLAYTGVGATMNAAAEAAIRGEGARTLAQFETMLLGAQQAERELFRRGGFDFLNRVYQQALQFDYDRALLSMQADIAQDQQKAAMWGDIMASIGALGGMFGTAFVPMLGQAVGGGLPGPTAAPEYGIG